MKTNPLDLAAETTTLATCWLIQRTDGAEYRYTDHDRAIEVAGQGVPVDGTYLTAVGYETGEIQARADLSVDELTVGCVLDNEQITDAELRAGLFDYAAVRLFMVDWASPDGGIIKLRRGTLGEIAIAEGRFQAELRGMMQPVQQVVGEAFSPLCRADLGDSRCGVNLAAYTVTGTLTAVTDRTVVTDSARGEADGYFDNGVLTFTSGPNAGATREVKVYASGQFTLHQPAPYLAEVGDGYSVVPGCQKTIETCKAKFDNVINFRGEPQVPGVDEAFNYPNAR